MTVGGNPQWTSLGLLPAPAMSNLDDWSFTNRALALLHAMFVERAERCSSLASLTSVRDELDALQAGQLLIVKRRSPCPCPGAARGPLFLTTRFADAVLRVLEAKKAVARIESMQRLRPYLPSRRAGITIDRFAELVEAISEYRTGADERDYIRSLLRPHAGCAGLAA